MRPCRLGLTIILISIFFITNSGCQSAVSKSGQSNSKEKRTETGKEKARYTEPNIYAGKSSWEIYVDHAEKIKTQLRDLDSRPKELRADIEQYFRLLEKLKKLKASVEDERSSEAAEKSISRKEYKEKDAESDKYLEHLNGKYGQSVSLLLQGIFLKMGDGKNRKPFDRAIYESALKELKSGKTNDGRKFMHIVSPHCIQKNGKFDRSCTKGWIEACSASFGSERNKLKNASYNEDFEVELDDALDPSMMVENENRDKVKSEPENYLLLYSIFYGCKFIAEQGYEFESKTVEFPPIDKTEWIGYLNEVDEVSNVGNFRIYCPKNGDQAGSRLGRLMKDKNLHEEFLIYLRGAKKGLEACGKFVQKTCENVVRLNEEYLYSYQTTACEIRSVTSKDIKADAERWRKAGEAEGEIQSHLAIATIIDFCEEAISGGYEHMGKIPTLNRSICKSR